MALLNLFISGANGTSPAMHMRGKRGGEDSESQEDEGAWRHVHGRSPDSRIPAYNWAWTHLGCLVGRLSFYLLRSTEDPF